ncbi:hypothetical protein DFW101_0496 [Solidesulfovibrio carbinoliphilus subsp. oakridgensis]|uniref:Uncharacterized protein n=1 Tax=Solidesulfovibrio carbinoliphilus subsp. oakridgensis TaxID=694327 RepID=G7QDK7_9BACT|nr:hypothetical protein [Solidesulfovibrio carbinoliphilus]EHJ46513.1 hypothetical protein DFW101_0496 [Solidesulfovibrio carbinoliphilus subsp. oakridgensis]
MKRTLALMAATGALLLHVGTAPAQEKATGKTPMEPRGGIGAPVSPRKDDTARTGGRRVDPYVSDSMARRQSVRPTAEAPSLGVGGGGVVDDKALPTERDKVRDKGPELGGSVPLSKTVSLKAAGRYEHLGSIADKGFDGLGGNLGLKISF